MVWNCTSLQFLSYIYIYICIYDINCMPIHATAFFPQFPVYQLIVSYGQTVIVSNNKC